MIQELNRLAECNHQIAKTGIRQIHCPKTGKMVVLFDDKKCTKCQKGVKYETHVPCSDHPDLGDGRLR